MIHFVIDLLAEARGHIAVAAGGSDPLGSFEDLFRVGNAPGGEQGFSYIDVVGEIAGLKFGGAERGLESFAGVLIRLQRVGDGEKCMRGSKVGTEGENFFEFGADLGGGLDVVATAAQIQWR